MTGEHSTTAPTASARAAAGPEGAALLQRLLPAALVPLFNTSFVRSWELYEEFVYRLALQVFLATSLDQATREPGGPHEIAARAGLEPGRALIPLEWILRALAARRLLDEETAADGARRFRSHAQPALPALDPVPVREEQRRLDPSWLPSYVLAETAARDYPAFLRGQMGGEEILFSPSRFRLWLEYFSNDNGLYAVNNQVGAIAVEQWLPPGGAAILELGGGLASAAIALLERLDHSGRLGQIRQYRFTEVVPAFLRRGQQTLQARFPGAACLTFGALDMNRPFAEQGIPPASVSAVYAVNTLHVAHDLDFTLAEILHALEPGGQLIVSECIRPRPDQLINVEFIFNLMKAFRAPLLNPAYRPNGGFLTPEQWTAAVEAAGFAHARLLPDIARLRGYVPTFYVAAIGATRPA